LPPPAQPVAAPPPRAPAPQQWAAIDFARDVVLQGRLGAGAFGTVYAALWLRPPPSVVALLGGSVAAGAGAGAEAVRVAVKVVPLMMDGGSTYSARSLDSLKQEIQVGE
jgi:hypothetical protein